MSNIGDLTDDSAMGSCAARDVSLKPTIAMSRPTSSPWQFADPMAPIAAKSLTAKIALG